MKKIFIFSVLMLMTGMVASAQSVIVEDVTVKTNETASVNIVLRGATGYTAIGFSLELPEDFMVATEMDNGVMNYMIDVNSDFIDDHTVVSKMKSTNNVMRVAVFSEKNKPFKSNDGTILTLIVKTTGRKGTYHAKLKSLELANSSNNVVTLSDVSFNIKVESIGVIGDVNNDGSITVADVMGQVSIIMGKDNETTPKFNHETADINSDNAVTVADVMSLVRIILNGGSADTPTSGLSLSESMLNMEIGQRELVIPFNGSGNYAVMSSNEQVAKVVVEQKSLLDEDDEYMLVWVTAVGKGTANITVTDAQTGETATIEVTVTIGDLCPDDNHPHMIDLGLPSGTKWACCNVNTEHPENQSPTNYGGYYAWGETEEKSYYRWDTYIHCDGSSSNCHDLGSDISGTIYDVAHVKWGDVWRMPSSNQIDELLENCFSEWTTVDGIDGRIFIGSNGGCIFLPAAGYRWYGGFNNTGKYGHYLTSSQHPSYSDQVFYLSFLSSDALRTFNLRGYGQSVRPVATENPLFSLQLSESEVDLVLGEEAIIDVTSGSGNYTAVSNAKFVGKVTVEGSKVIIKAVGLGIATITVTDTRIGESATIEMSVVGVSNPVSYLTCPDNNHPHMIDLGLPSGTKWACCDVGAAKPEGTSGYFAWGEVDERTSRYSWVDYIHCDGSRETCHDLGSDIAGTQYDAAHVIWGDNWEMPSMEQFQELLDYCTIERSTLNSKEGRKITGPNGSSIFLHASGYRSDGDVLEFGNKGSFWSSTQDPSTSYNAYYIYFYGEKKTFLNQDFRSTGRSVRPVAAGYYVAHLQLSESNVEITDVWETTVEITSGYGNYTVSSSDENVATATIEGSSVKINTIGIGTAIITVTDMQSNETANIEVTITDIPLCPDNHHPHMIDLGLPSGTKWSCCNVGADVPEAYGGYYAWGETEEKDTYSWSTYAYCDGSNSTCYDLGSDIANTEYDVAYVKWGENWVMPSLDQIKELLNNCTSEWVTKNNVNGRKITGSNGNRIFFPAAGYNWGSSGLLNIGSYGYYRSSTKVPSSLNDKAYYLIFYSGNANWNEGNYRYARLTGMSVRPVVP